VDTNEVGSQKSADQLWRENVFAPNDPCQHINADGTTYSTFYPPASSSTAGGSSGTGWRLPSQSEWASLYRGGSTAGAAANALANTWSIYRLANVSEEGAKGYELKPDGVTTTLFLPANGYRHYITGRLYYSGVNGYYWSGSASGVNASLMYFTNGGTVNPASVLYRGYGYAVRCIKN